MRAIDFGRKAALSQAILFALGATAVETDALAQDVPAEDAPAQETVVVTGSRIVRRDFEAQTPIVTIEAETFSERVNVGLEAALNQLPQFNTAGTQASNSPANTPFPSASSAPGAATLDLRGLGTNRNLILVNGRRVQPVNGFLVVDLNTIPAAAIDRVEVITGGAAAVYGADAISGVVNFILKDDFEGFEFSSQYGISEEGDGAEVSINGLFGTDYAGGAGNIMLGADYSRREIIYGSDRDWRVRGWFDPGTNAGGIGSSNIAQYQVSAANAPVGAPARLGATYGIDANGNIFDPLNPLNPNISYTGPLNDSSGFRLNPPNANGIQSLGYNDFDNNFLQLPLERYSVFGNADFALTDNISLFGEMRFSQVYASAQGFTSGVFNVWSPTIPYNPQYDDPDSPDFGNGPQGFAHHPVSAALADLLNARPDSDEPWIYVGGLDYLENFETQTTTNLYQVVGGLEGEARVNDRDWYWNAFASHGKTTVNAHQPEGFPYLPRLQNLFNADHYGRDFDISSLPGFFPLAVTGHCTSGLPIFDENGDPNNTPFVSKDCSDYVVLRMNSVTTLTQDIVEATVSGGLADLPAGEVLFALGIGSREEEFAFDPDSGFNANQDFPNVVQNIILPVTVDGTTDVKEIFGEIAIPLVSDRRFVQSFEVVPGVRFSEYSTVGSEETYKFLFDWDVNDRLRFRGGRQVATRAPNVTELFTPLGGSILEGAAQDACGNWPQTQSWGNIAGNPNRFNLQLLCQELMVRDGAPPSLYEPGQPSANDWAWNVFGGNFNFPFTIGVTEGNPDLGSETAETYTFGLVLNFDSVTLAIDFYEIELANAIETPSHSAVYQQCLDPVYNPLIASAPGTHTGAELAAANRFCDLINREYVGGTPLTPGNFGAARTFDARYINQGTLTSEGVDIQLDWGRDFDNGGALNLSLIASILDVFSEAAFPGAIPIEFTGTQSNSSFDYQTFVSATYASGPWSVGIRWAHMPGLLPVPGSNLSTNFGVNAHDETDLFSSWSFNDRYRLRFGIDNLFNEDPAVVGATTANNALGSTSSNYDQFGRRYYVGLSVSL